MKQWADTNNCIVKSEFIIPYTAVENDLMTVFDEF